jgi:HAD superfamily hydrolase (TIGR01549 family)
MMNVVFLDVGGVILDESNLEQEKAQILTEIISSRVPYDIKQYWRDTFEATQIFVPSTYDFVLYKSLGLEAFWSAKHRFNEIWNSSKHKLIPMTGLRDFFSRISGSFKVGILGQYGNEILELLEDEGVLDFLTYRHTQEEFNLTKPDPRYFEAVIARCGESPDHCIMIGDRIDKDVIPARQIGMKTVRIKTGIHKEQKPRTPSEIPDSTVESLEEITESSLSSIWEQKL